MACHMKNIHKGGLLGTNKVFICLWLVMLLVLSSEEMGSEGCNIEGSKTWNHKICVKHGTCNTPCRAEGFDHGSCQFFNLCMCYRHCGPPTPEVLEEKRWKKLG